MAAEFDDYIAGSSALAGSCDLCYMICSVDIVRMDGGFGVIIQDSFKPVLRDPTSPSASVMAPNI